MSIERIKGKFFVVCDVCSDQILGGSTFKAAVSARKEEGWESQRIGDGWQDVCPECAEKVAAKGGRL